MGLFAIRHRSTTCTRLLKYIKSYPMSEQNEDITSFPENQMVDVGRDPEKSPMRSNRTEGDYIDSVREGFWRQTSQFPTDKCW